MENTNISDTTEDPEPTNTQSNDPNTIQNDDSLSGDSSISEYPIDDDHQILRVGSQTEIMHAPRLPFLSIIPGQHQPAENVPVRQARGSSRKAAKSASSHRKMSSKRGGSKTSQGSGKSKTRRRGRSRSRSSKRANRKGSGGRSKRSKSKKRKG